MDRQSWDKVKWRLIKSRLGADDLASFEARSAGPNLRFENVVKDLRKRGKL